MSENCEGRCCKSRAEFCLSMPDSDEKWFLCKECIEYSFKEYVREDSLESYSDSESSSDCEDSDDHCIKSDLRGRCHFCKKTLFNECLYVDSIDLELCGMCYNLKILPYGVIKMNERKEEEKRIKKEEEEKRIEKEKEEQIRKEEECKREREHQFFMSRIRHNLLDELIFYEKDVSSGGGVGVFEGCEFRKLIERGIGGCELRKLIERRIVDCELRKLIERQIEEFVCGLKHYAHEKWVGLSNRCEENFTYYKNYGFVVRISVFGRVVVDGVEFSIMHEKYCDGHEPLISTKSLSEIVDYVYKLVMKG